MEAILSIIKVFDSKVSFRLVTPYLVRIDARENDRPHVYVERYRRTITFGSSPKLS
jgi:hypothetical protein